MKNAPLASLVLVFMLSLAGCESDISTDNSNDQPGSGVMFGMATKCMQDATFLQGPLQFQVACSPIFQGVDYNDVETQIQNWRQEYCPSQVSAQLASGAFCTVNAYAGGAILATDPQDVQDEANQTPEDCTAQPGVLYGTPSC